MGTLQYVSRILKRCRSLKAAVVLLGFWLCIITVINLSSSDQHSRLEMKEDAPLFLLPGVLTSVPSLLGLSLSDKGTQLSSNGRTDAGLVLSNELKSFIRGLNPASKALERQASSLVKDGFISGRRIQEIKTGQIAVLEKATYRGNNDFRDKQMKYRSNSGLFVSNEQSRIDSLDIRNNGANFKPSGTSLKVLQPHNSHDSHTHLTAFSSYSNRDSKRGHILDEIKQNGTDSYRTKISQSKSTGYLKASSQSSEKTGFKTNAHEKSISGHLLASMSEKQNGESNFYTSAEINTYFNRDERQRAREKDTRMDYDHLRAVSIEHSYHTPSAPLAEAESVKNVQIFSVTSPKSNINNATVMQMGVPGGSVEYLPKNFFDQSLYSSRSETKPADYRYGTHFFLRDEERQQGNNERTQPFFITTKPSRNTVMPILNQISSRQKVKVDINSGFYLETNEHPAVNNNRTLNSVLETNMKPPYKASNGQTWIKPPHAHRLKCDGFELYSYNVTVSDQLALNRNIPDTRPGGCESLPAYTAANLARSTVIICFHNEALSVLLRTVHSVLDRTPRDLLEKIILVDDFSTQDDLTTQLDEHISSLGNVILTRTSKREGLVGARILGIYLQKGTMKLSFFMTAGQMICSLLRLALEEVTMLRGSGSTLATSEVIVFLDAHCECNVGWLEPLLFSLSVNPKKVVSPYIDTIRSENFQYKQSPTQLRGGFTWRLEFGWRAATGGSNSLEETQPILTPVISGGLFAVRRDYFMSLGTYDPQLNIWGGENLELSFKTWMCGGSVEIVPCSRVGHVFRSSLPYTFTEGRERTVLRNLARVASVWMDSYADIFYAAVNLPNDLDIGDISERIQLRQNLNCKSFKWYLQNVFPEIDVVSPDTVVYGQVRNKGSLMCVNVINSATGYYLGLSACNGGRNQTLHLTSDNQLKQGSACIVPGLNKQLTLSRCSAAITWIYERDQLQLNNTDLCITSVDNELVHLLPCHKQYSRTAIQLRKGDNLKNSINNNGQDYKGDDSVSSSSFQHWTFDYSFNWKRRRRNG